MIRAAALPLENSPLDLFLLSLRAVTNGAALPLSLSQQMNKILMDASRVKSIREHMELEQFSSESIFLAAQGVDEADLLAWAARAESNQIDKPMAEIILKRFSQEV